MDSAIQICFTCLSTDRELIKYINIDNNIAAFYERFVADGSEMGTQHLNYLCENCCMQLKNSYCFWKQCMQSKSRLDNYVSELENHNRNYYNMEQPVTQNNVVIKNEEDENIVLMELGSMNTNNMNPIERYQAYHNFSTNENFNGNMMHVDQNHFQVKIEAEENYNDIHEQNDFHNMDFNVKTEETSITKPDKERKVLNKPFQCDICLHKFVNKGNLRRHIVLLHSDQSNSLENGENSTYPCTYCPKKFSTKNNLIRHTQKHTGELAFKCKLCTKSFSNKTLCTRHEQTHSRITIYECDICKAEYRDLEEFRNHRNGHETNSTFKCEKCNKTFETEEFLTNHKKESCEKYIEANYPCPKCDKKFKSNKKLQRHLTLHSEDDGFKCMYDNCNKYFHDRLSFKEHTKMHIQLKNFECPTCLKKFTSESKFHDHQNMHLGIKPYECMICQKWFSLAGSLDVHLKTHTDEQILNDKPYKCPVCNKCYLSKSALKLHEDVHSNEMYHCKDCSLEFNSRSTLYRHVKKVHLAQSLNNEQLSSENKVE